MSNPAFPTINSAGQIIVATSSGLAPATQFPYQEHEEWIVAEAHMDNGMSFTYQQNATVLRRFQVNYDLISRSELTILETFFDSMRGRLGYFTFTDDDGTVWNNCRFDQDDMIVTYPQVNWFSTKFAISAEQN